MYDEKLKTFLVAYKLIQDIAEGNIDIIFALAYAAGVPMINLRTEHQAFPLGVELTSKENGELIIATDETPKEQIVGKVTMMGFEVY